MSDEFDDTFESPPQRAGERPARRAASAPQLVARLYAAASAPLRQKLLACLLRPLGTLGLARTAAGAFAGPLQRRVANPGVRRDDAERCTKHQIVELARFVEEVDPQALHRFAGLVSDSKTEVAAFSAAAVPLLVASTQGAEPEAAGLRLGRSRKTGAPSSRLESSSALSLRSQ